MIEKDNGFSFGSSPAAAGDGAGDVIEVDGEPVSRNEARHMGLDLGVSKESRDANASTNVFRIDQLPKDIGDDLVKKLERAWTHLKKDEVEEALTLAQEIVWQRPALVAAKLVIARCFINRREYEKALSILHAISENDANAETMYYIGLAQSRLGRVKEAVSALNLSRASSPDDLTRKRATDLLNHLRGEQAPCPICGKKNLYDSMVEVGDRMICANCAQGIESGQIDADAGNDEDSESETDFSRGSRRYKRLRRPLTSADILLRLLLAALIVGLILYLLYSVMPDYYATVHSLIPGGDFILPPPPYHSASSPPPGANTPDAPGAIPAPEFDSRPLGLAIAGVEMRRRLRIAGMGDGGGVYTATFEPVPDGPHDMNAVTGELVWLPSARDAGKTFAVTFGAAFGDVRARDRRDTVRVSRGLAAERVGAWPNPVPGSMVHIMHDNLTGAAESELILVSGLYRQGSAAIMRPAQNGENQVVSRMDLAGMPVGAGIIAAGGEKWLAVADFWNSRLRYFVFRNGALSEIAASTTLPGRPILAAFHREGSVSAVLCRTGSGYRLLAYIQTDQRTTAKLGEWTVPDDVAWRNLFVLVPAGAEPRPLLALVGADAGRSLVFSGPDATQPLKGEVPGFVMDAAQERGGRLHLLIKENDAQKLVTLDLENPNPITEQIAVGDDATLGGLTAADLSGSGTVDLAFLSGTRVGVSFERGDGGRTRPGYWPLASAPLLFGNPGIMPGDRGDKVVYADTQGTLWALGLDG